MFKKKCICALTAAAISVCLGVTAYADSSSVSAVTPLGDSSGTSGTYPTTATTQSTNLNDTSSYYQSSSSYTDSTSTQSDSSAYVPDEFSHLSEREYELLRELADGLMAEDSEIDYYGEDYYDTDGNATLINNQRVIYNSAEMQFISVTTKDGNVFYVLINYSDEDDVDNVYFLNKVDDYDLYALLYASDSESDMTPEEAADMALGNKQEVKESAETETESTEESAEETQSASSTSSSSSGNMVTYGIIGVAVIVGAFLFMNKKKGANGNKTSSNISDEDDDFDDDVYVNEDEE